MKTGDILRLDNHAWRVVGIHLGGIGTESLIEAESITHEPGWTGEWESHPRVFIPEILTRQCRVEES